MKKIYCLSSVVLTINIISILILSGCSSEVYTPSTTSRVVEVETTTSATATSAETTPAQEFLKYSSTHEYIQSDGYKYTETYTVWEPDTTREKSSIQHPLDNSFTLGDFDPKVDLVIPMQIQIQNTTPSFDLENAQTIVCLYGNRNIDSNIIKCIAQGKIIKFIANFSDGTSSVDWGATISDGWNGQALAVTSQSSTNVSWPTLPPDSISTINCFVVICDYYTPAYPDGSELLLDRLAIGSDGSGAIITFSGKGI